MNGAMVEVSGKQQHSGLAGFAWEQGLDVSSFEARSLKMTIERNAQVARRSLWIPKGACSPRVSRAVNGAMVEVSGKQQHSGLGGFAWEQGLDVCSFEARS